MLVLKGVRLKKFVKLIQYGPNTARPPQKTFLNAYKSQLLKTYWSTTMVMKVGTSLGCELEGIWGYGDLLHYLLTKQKLTPSYIYHVCIPSVDPVPVTPS